MKEIKLTRGIIALIDDEDFELISSHHWFADAKGYAVSKVPHPFKKGERSVLRMHRLVLGLGFDDKIQVDHIDLNKSNNQKSNLRKATNSQNKCNSAAYKTSKSGVKGAYFSEKLNIWRSSIRSNGKLKHLGCFKTAEEAHAAYCIAAKEIHGEFARFE